MGAIVNGLAAHGGFIGYGSTFLIFSDYMRPPIRLAALMGLHVIHVFTHDSLALGEDGPTHQPIEQLASLRAIPRLTRAAPRRRQRDRGGLEGRDRDARPAGAARAEPAGRARRSTAAATRAPRAAPRRLRAERREGKAPALILIASGSEVGLIVAAAERLRAEGVAVRCVSMPSWELFEAQPQSYRDEVLPPEVTARLAVELGVAQGWHRYVGERGDMLGIDRFGASAPGRSAAARIRLHRRWRHRPGAAASGAMRRPRQPGPSSRQSHPMASAHQNSVCEDDSMTAQALRSLQRNSFDYFVYEVNRGNGLVLDKTAAGWPASIAAMGMALSAYLVGAERPSFPATRPPSGP